MADGVPAAEVYSVLDTEEGLDRAFRKLDIVKDQTVWWEAGAQPPQMLADGEVLMTTAYNGRIFNAQVLENQPFEIVWDGQVLDSAPPGRLGRHAPLLRGDAIRRIRLPPVLAGRRRAGTSPTARHDAPPKP